MDLNQIGLDDLVAALPLIALLGGALGWLAKAYLAESAAKRQAQGESRDDRREDFTAIVTQQAETIRRLEERVTSLETKGDRLERELVAERELRLKLTVKVAQYESSIQFGEERTRTILKRCPVYRSRPCPWAVEMHDPDVIPPVRAPELVGGGNPVGGAGS